jgi:TonB-dependent SusC/RagA subfamily outer membrane receptor
MKRQILNFLLLIGFFTVTAQEGSITGSVSDAINNDPLPGVNVVVKNTNNGTNTDFNGNFSLDGVNNGDILVFSYLGFKTLEYTVSDSFNISISLEEDVEALEQVVVLGYVSQKASNISGAVSTVGGDDIEKLKPVRMEDALQGLPGVNMFSNGSPGSKPTVIIRGVTSYTGNDPLVIVDGINQSLDDMNSLEPSDIKSISVLKDASTTALYGVKGGNGVIVITTKSGSRNQEAKFSFNTSYGEQSPEKTIGVLNATEYAAILNEMSLTSGGGLIYSDLSGLGYGTDWQKEIFRIDAPIISNNISVSGGTNNSSYFLSAGFLGQEGIIHGGDKQFF